MDKDKDKDKDGSSGNETKAKANPKTKPKPKPGVSALPPKRVPIVGSTLFLRRHCQFPPQQRTVSIPAWVLRNYSLNPAISLRSMEKSFGLKLQVGWLG